MNNKYAIEQLSLLRSDDVQTQVRVLRELVMDLMIEVEALRAAQLARPQSDRAAYRSAYETTALASHNSAGAFGSPLRLLEMWYGTEDLPPSLDEDWVRREVALLRRLGATEAEIEEHLRRAAYNSSLT